MTWVQTLVPLRLDLVNAGRLSLARFVDLTSAGPRGSTNRLQGPNRRRYDADFTIVDLKRSEAITNKWVASRPAGRLMTACASPAGRRHNRARHA